MRTKKERRKLHIQKKKNPNMLVPKKEKIKWQNKKKKERKKEEANTR